MSGGIIMVASDVEKATRYLDRCAGGLTPIRVTQAWARRAYDLPSWLANCGMKLDLSVMAGPEHPDFDGADGVWSYRQALYRDGTRANVRLEDIDLRAHDFHARKRDPALRSGLELYDELVAAVARRPGIAVRWESPALRLIRDSGGRVSGVTARTADGAMTVNARHGVILACGGYEYDEETKRQYLKAFPTHFYGNPGNTGDGIRMAQAVGADLWHMNLMIGRGMGYFPVSDDRFVGFNLHIDPPGYVITDKYGRRYMNEHNQARQRHDAYYNMLSFDDRTSEYPRIPSYWFFDQRRLKDRALAPVGVGAVAVGLYEWSPDNQREVERGWIKVAPTVREVAALAGVADPDAADQSVRDYNDFCLAGGDTLGRPRESLIPLDQPPYCCVPLYPGGANTCGGPRRNENGQILSPFGEPIDGLYGAGELGGAIGLVYPGDGANLSDCFCFGQIAAEHALGTS